MSNSTEDNLQSRIKQIQTELENAKREPGTYLGATAFNPFLPPYDPQFTNCRSVQVNRAQHQPQYDMQQQLAAEVEAASEHEMMIGMDVGGSGTVHAGLGLGTNDGFGIESPNELQIQVHPQYMHRNLFGQQHDDTMNDDGTIG